jgi:hypothetical protein
MQHTDVRNHIRRAERFEHSDGFTEILLGSTLAAFALATYLLGPLAEQSPWQSTAGIIALAAVVAFAFGVQWLITLLRRHLIYPRVGYARSPASRLWWVLSCAVAGAVIALSATQWARSTETAATSRVAIAIGVGILCLILAIRFHLVHFAILAALSCALGFVPQGTRIDGPAAVVLYAAVMSAATIVSGCIALFAVLRLPGSAGESHEQ